MSNTTRINSVIIDNENFIRAAVKQLAKLGVNITLAQNVRPRMYYNKKGQYGYQDVGNCEFVLKLNNCSFDVGMKWNEQAQTYEFIFDAHASEVHRQIGLDISKYRGVVKDNGKVWSQEELNVGHNLGQFVKEYNMELFRNDAVSQGLELHNVEELRMPNGNTLMKIENQVGAQL